MLKARAYFSDFILNPVKEYSQQFRMLHTNGNWITILSRAMAMRNNEGELTGMVIGTHLDITNIQETAENLISTQKNLKKVKNKLYRIMLF